MDFEIYDDEPVRETVKWTVIRRLFEYLRPYKVQVGQTLALMGLVIVVELFNPYFMKLAIDRFIAGRDIGGLLRLGTVAVAVNLAAMAGARYRIRIMAAVSSEILLTIRQDLYRHIQKLPFSYFDNRPVGKILARVIGDVNSLNDLFTNSVTHFLPDLATMAAVIGIMIAMNPALAGVALLTVPVLGLGFLLIQGVSHRRWRIYRHKIASVNAFTHENFSGIRVVQSFTAESRTARKFAGLLKVSMNAFIRAVRLNDLLWPMVELSWGVSTMAIFWYGVRLLETGTISIGLLVAFSGYLSLFWNPVMNISNFYNSLVANMSGAERIFEIMALELAIQDRKDARTLPKIRGEVVFKEVTFSYVPGQVVLDRVSFQVRPGETVALVGPTGAGKTSIVNLLCRFYELDAGAILVDGYPVNTVTLESLRSQFGMVLQDTFLFSGSIRDNIRYGRLEATDEEVVAAARAVHAHEFIMKLPHGYATDVNERGSRLSFGQRQQIAFARALLADPGILILDEATAGVDTETERLIQQGIQKILAGRTAFVIAHRLSTIRQADRILVVAEGRIREAGTHDQLLRAGGLYARLYETQYRFLDEGVPDPS